MSQTTSDRTRSAFQQQKNQEDTVKAVAARFDDDAGRYEKLLPSHIKLDDFRNAFLTSVQRNPRLLEADRSSFWLALQQAASDGLKCDNREAALVIFSDDDEEGGNRQVARGGKLKQVVYMPMVTGLRKLLRNTGVIAKIETDLIFRGEVVEIWMEDGHRHFKHVVNTSPDADRSDQNIVGAYAVVNFKDGTWQPEWMSRAEIDKIRAISRAKSARAPWQTFYGEMAKKTVLRRLAKQLDKSPEVAALQDALERDPTAGDTIEGEAVEIAEAVAARPIEQPRHRSAQNAEHHRDEHAEPQRATQQSVPKPTQPEDPEAWRKDVGSSGQTATTEASGQGSTPSVGRTAPSSPQETTPAQDAAAGSPADGGFEAWIVNANGEETRQDSYTDPVEFARDIATLCRETPPLMDDILEANNPAIEDACDASDEARTIIDAIKAPPPVQTNSVSEETSPVRSASQPVVIEVPKTPKGAPHWGNYVDLAKKALDSASDVAAAQAWMQANRATFDGKSSQATVQIDRHYAATMARLGAPEAPPTDKDRERAERFKAEIVAHTDQHALTRWADNAAVKVTMDRWQRERPELYTEISDMATSHRNNLRANRSA